MNIKLLCSCGTKFSFDVEPVDGKMPVQIFCPKCGADVTETANALVQDSTTSQTPVVVETEKPKMRLQVAKHSAPEISAASNDSATTAPGVEMCSRHPRAVATEHCVVCKKPICPECMQSFGFLCSVNCRYRADQEQIKVPVYKLQRNVVERAESRKTLGILSAVLLVILALVGAWFWYIFYGSKPHPFYSFKLPQTERGAYAKFIGPNRILLLNNNEVALHDIKSKKNAWTTELKDPKPASGAEAAENSSKSPAASDDDDGSDFFSNFSSASMAPFFSGDNVWVCLAHNVVCVDLKSGSVKYTIPFRGRLDAFTPGDSTLLVVSQGTRGKRLLTQIATASGEVKTAEAVSSLREKLPTSKELPPEVLPTAALLLKYELQSEENKQPSLYKFSSEFFPAGQNVVEMQVKLVEPKVALVKTMKDPKASHLNENTSSSTSARSVAEEIFNEQKRAATGGFRRVDESHYSILLRRTLETDAADWSGDVNGTPLFFPAKTVDTLFAGKTLLIFDKHNKKIGESQLSYPVNDLFTSGFRMPGLSPCLEHDGTLFVFDKGVLTAFELPSCNVKWRLPSAGISDLQFDENGMLYVSTTTASPDDIQYADEIKINDSTHAIILKVDPKSGKALWKSEQYGDACFLTGKYVYMTDASRGGFSMILATEDAFGVRSQRSGNLNIHRVDPASGKKIWSYFKKGSPTSIDFSENRVLLHYGDEIEVLKFLSF